MIVLDAEFNALSNGTRFNGGHRYKKRVILQISGTSLVNLARIRYMICAGSLVTWVRYRIKLSIE